jgi:hypothetical protein
MWFLWIFGDNVEDRLGRIRFALFYLACGCAAAVFQVWMAPWSAVPIVGASGAIAGVLGAYIRLFPSARVLTVVPFVFWFFELRAVFFLGFWFLLQLASTLLGEGGVAWWAHIAGFGTGFLFALFVRPVRIEWEPQDPRVLRRRRI